MKHEVGEFIESTHRLENDPGPSAAGPGGGDHAGTGRSERRLSPRLNQNTEVARSEDAQASTNADVKPNPTLSCLICSSSFLQSTAFSAKNNFTSNYSGKVWKIFCGLLSPQLATQNFTFEKYPLPFCTGCAKNVIGLTKLQEELELLQATIDFGMGEIREKIQRTEIDLAPPGLQDYALTLEEVRSYAVEDSESSRRRSNMAWDTSSRPQLQHEQAETTEVYPLGSEGDPLDSSPTPAKRNRLTVPASESVVVKPDTSQMTDGYEFTFDESYFEADARGSGSSEASPPTPFNLTGNKKDPKLDALVKKLSIRTRKNILRRRQQQQELKSKEKLNRRKRAPFGKVIDTEDGRLMFQNVVIHREEIAEGEDQTKYRCDLCNSRLKDLRLMRRHIRAAHKNGIRKDYRCNICGKVLTNVGSLPRHMAIFHSKTGRRPSYSCDLCGKVLSSDSTLKCHKAVVHGVGIEKYKHCDICERRFRSERSMKQHRLSHMNEEERAEVMRVEQTLQVFQCHQCGKELSCAGTLRQHMMIHEDVLPFTCDVCGWGFRHKCNLQAHLELHRGEERLRKFKCNFPDCERSYPTRTQLVIHSYVHRPPEEKPFKCVHPGCTVGFSRSHDLTQHRRTHTGERPYKCTLCPKKFSRSHHLKRHCNNVHDTNALLLDNTTELITAEIIEPEPTSNMTIEFVITGAEGDSFTLPDIKL